MKTNTKSQFVLKVNNEYVGPNGLVKNITDAMLFEKEPTVKTVKVDVKMTIVKPTKVKDQIVANDIKEALEE